LLALVCASAAAVPAVAADASVWIASGGSAPTLRIDARGDAEASWVQAGARQYVVVPEHGQLYHGRLAAADVSRAGDLAQAADALVVRKGPGGTVWALQRWQAAGQPPALHLARWHGAPTQLTLSLSANQLTGSVSFQGRPVTGFSPTNGGKRQRIYVYLACSGCNGATGWSAMLGVVPRADGTFSVLLRPTWIGHEYRADVEGPNLGSTLAPDAEVTVAGS
jgi:hypothetical protein